MSKMPNPIHDILARALATEAVVGLLTLGTKPNEEAVHNWLEVVLKSHPASNNLLPRAMYFAKRMTAGPIEFEDANFGVWTSAQLSQGQPSSRGKNS